jgi:hypothetical protein
VLLSGVLLIDANRRDALHTAVFFSLSGARRQREIA